MLKRLNSKLDCLFGCHRWTYKNKPMQHSTKVIETKTCKHCGRVELSIW